MRADLLFRECDALGGKVAHHFLKHVVVTRLLEVGGDDFLGIRAGGVAGDSELLRDPQAQQFVSAGKGLEFVFLVERELLLKTLLTLFE